MKTKTLQINNITCVKMLFGAVIISVFVYVYMVNLISFNTANRGRIADLISIRQSEVGELESQFLAESRKIDREVAMNLGLVKSVANDAVVVVRDSNSRLTLNEQ